MTAADVIARLAQLGYTATESDAAAIEASIVRADTYIKAFCHIDSIPTELEPYAIDRACGEFLSDRRYIAASGEGGNAGIKRITEGDTTIEYSDSTTASGRLDTIIGGLLRTDILIAFRRLRW
ncbi:MAG: hypothetical protein J6U98_02820 [Abditibacteriota bacterium]|nr:hypothetical protein [Abditibacteriota bacterium]MBP5738615.1 hypothetical protein [Abditibacteriota bacterium]